MSAEQILMNKVPLTRHAEGVYTVGGQGNSVVIDMGDALLLVDAGPGGAHTQRMIEQVQHGLGGKPVGHIVYSHGHMGYNNGVREWRDAAAQAGQAPPLTVAHERVAHRYRRYLETAGLQAYTNTRQFRTPYPSQPPAHWFVQPEITYSERLVIDGSARQVELISAPSETDDGTALWVPDVRVLYGGNAVINTCPNAGSPYRILRDPVRWAATLEKLLALQPLLLIPEFGKPLAEPGLVRQALDIPARALRWLRAETVRRMNLGMGETDIVHDIVDGATTLPDELFASRFMRETYGCVEYIIRDIWRSENGWWNRNPTDLHPAAPAQAARAVREALPDAARVLQQALALQREGRTQLALHVIDLLALDDREDAPDDNAAALVRQAKALKAQLCEQRAQQVSSVVSRNLYLSAADDLMRREIGATVRGDQTFAWQ